MARFIAAALLFSLMSFEFRAETALQVGSWCKDFSNAVELGSDGRFQLNREWTPDDSFCWGAFAVIQEFATYASASGYVMLGICAPASSTRIQLIRIFSKYVEDHPATANVKFARIARQALAEAFPCTGTAPPR